MKKSITTNKDGRPSILARYFILRPYNRLVHVWASSNLKKDDVVLDVGARDFPFTKYQDAKVIFGVDLFSESEGYLGWSDDILADLKKHKNLYPIVGNCEELPFVDNSFDKIIMTEVIEHVENNKKAISELARVLKKDGILFLTTPNDKEVIGKNQYHIHQYTKIELEKLLRKYFKDVSVVEKFPNPKFYVKQYEVDQNLLSGLFWTWAYAIWLKLYGERNYPGGYNLIAVAKKPYKNRKSLPCRQAGNLENQNYRKMLACPQCKNPFENPRLMRCQACGKDYIVKKNIPILLTNLPHHQKGKPRFVWK